MIFPKGLNVALCEACEKLGWKIPTKIQCESLPVAFQSRFLFFFFIEVISSRVYLDRDIIGLAETGSGKTGAFALPILQALLTTNQRLFALVLTPTRELAYQISEQFEALGSTIGVKCGMWKKMINQRHCQ